MHSARIAGSLGLAFALLVAGTASAQDGAKADEGALKYRQSLMESVGGDMASMGNILKYGLPFTANISVHADSLAAHAKLAKGAFEKKVIDGPTDAEPAIWEKTDEFAKGISDFEAATAKLAEVAKTGDPAQIGPQLKATGKTCGGCHDNFRKPKEESYMRDGGHDE